MKINKVLHGSKKKHHATPTTCMQGNSDGLKLSTTIYYWVLFATNYSILNYYLLQQARLNEVHFQIDLEYVCWNVIRTEMFFRCVQAMHTACTVPSNGLDCFD